MDKYDIKNLTIKEKIGQLIVFGFHSDVVDNHALSLIKEYKAGNVILFSRNVKNAKQVYELNQNLQRVAKESTGIPLFIAIDQEGGMVSRIHDAGTYFPGAMTITATNNSENAYLTGKYTGEELRSLLINMDFAPSLDVNNNPRNPVIGVRSFSDNPSNVSIYGCSFIKGLQEEKVIATAKHFPGHGDTSIDSHLALPTINYNLKRINDVEMRPFQDAIKNGVKAIMTSHIVFKEIDELPATLSKKWLTDILRDELSFKGLIVTDGMGMNAIREHYTINEGVLLAINAGANMFCLCHDENEQKSALDRLYKAYVNGELSIEVLDERVKRVLDYKKTVGFPNLNISYEDSNPLVKTKEHVSCALEVACDAITLVKGRQLVLNDNPLIIATVPVATTIADDRLGSTNIKEILNSEFKNSDIMVVDINPTEEQIKDVISQTEKHEQIILLTYNANVYHMQEELLTKIVSLKKETHVLSMRNPYDLWLNDEIENYVCFYEYTPNSVKALVKYLKGEIKPKGKLPVNYE